MLANSLNAYVESYAGLEGRELLSTVYRDFAEQVAVLSSFGAESAVLLHMVSEVSTSIPVIFLDTLKLFPETIEYRDSLIDHLGLRDVRTVMPLPADIEAGDPTGDLNGIDTDACCAIRKTRPLANAVQDFSVLISGRKRSHGADRRLLEFVSLEGEMLKVDPLAAYSSLDIGTYMQKHHLPTHPLRLRDYRSIGCMPCTIPGGSGQDPRAGRWVGTDKTECGIHFTANGKLIRKTNLQSGAAV
jgi:phosphoadenosine phosphosulfate reductase